MHALTSSAPRTDRRQTRLVIVRANGPLFYSVAIASFLEAVASGADTRRAAFLRDYVQQCWPEVDWAAALEHYRGLLATNGVAAPYRATPAREVLARCANAAQAALYYRALARWSDDHALRAFGRESALEAAGDFQRLRGTFDASARRERLGMLKSWQVVLACVRHARDMRVRLAFEALSAHCGPNAPFPTMPYPEFLQRMQAVIRRCAAPAWTETLVFGEWRRPAVVAAPAARQAPRASFRPVFAAAA